MTFNRSLLSKMLFKTNLFLLTAAIAACPRIYAATPCDAPWMHPEGQFVISSSPGKYVFTFDVLNFEKQDGDHCTASLRASTAFNFQGKNIESRSVFHVIVSNGLAQVEPDTSGSSPDNKTTPTLNPMLSEQLKGFFSYAGEIKQAGQTLPSSHASVKGMPAANGDAAEQPALPDMSFTTTDKHVGPPETLDTVAGKLDCWPVSFDLTENTGSITFRDRTIPGSQVIMQIVDHYCPATNLVMRKDITTDGSLVSQTVTSIK